MAFRDHLLPASYRGVPFWVDEDELTGGKRAEIHEYPERDLPFIEELGRSALKIRVAAHLLGEDYQTQRVALIEALETPGPASLILPTRGEIQAICLEHSTVERITGDRTRASWLSLTFVEAGANAYPQATGDTRSALVAAADPVRAVAEETFLERYMSLALPDWVHDSTAEALSTIARTVRESVALAQAPADDLAALGIELRDLERDATELVRAPQQLSQAMLAAYRSVGGFAGAPKRLYAALEDSLEALIDDPEIPETTDFREAQVVNRREVDSLHRRAMLAEIVTVTTRIEFEAAEDALAFRERIGGLVDREVESASETGDDEVTATLQDLLVAVSRDLAVRAQRLPSRVLFEAPATLPALVIAHRLYGSTERTEDIIDRNGIAHPGFVGSHRVLEVLDPAS